ncbi:hypothetical protein PG993_003687 [Apiospora rasikravindrae]|uniref:Uncharacterized protein n=1 Tax=Apiospora rasikravindrae TaxID=990691 RepID=A0ABR1U0A2_9PEZI
MKQLDVIFYSERYQRQKRHGMISWRLPAMVSDLYDLSKRNDIEMDPNLIQVDEGAWLNCLKRSRWFDRQVDALSTIPNPHPDLFNYQNNWWTVDNPAIWRILRIALEMVNRVLNTIIDARHPWLDTVLFSQLQRWADIDPEVRAHCDNKQIQSPGVMVERPPEERATSAEMRAALDDALRFCVLSFSDEASVPQSASNYGYSVFGFTQEAADNIMKTEQGGIPAVIQALQSTRNPNNFPRHVKRPQVMGGNSDLADFEDLMDIGDLVDQAAAQTPGPGGSVMDAAAFAAAAAGPISEDEFKVDPIDTLLCVFHVAPLRCLLNTQSKPFERYNALMSVATTILHELSVGFANTPGLCLLED